MRRLPEVHWSEGMFLRPQHLQLFARQMAGSLGEVRRQAQPFYWGLARLEVAEDELETASFALRAFDAVLKDGTRVELTANLRLDPRDFSRQLDASDGRLPVWLGVPRLQEGEPNTVSPFGEGSGGDLRYRVEAVEVWDENEGGAPQEVQVRKLNGRLFFGDEDREGYECLPVAVLERSSQGRNLPVLSERFIPPVIDVAAWPPLLTLAERVVNGVTAKFRFLRAEVAEGRMVLDTEASGGWQPVLKLQILGSFLHVLRQLTSLPGVHPFQLYLELSRLAGELSIFEEDGAEALPVPLYDQDRLGECFRQLIYTVERLLEKILSGDFVRVDFQERDGHLVAGLEPAWLAPGSQMYLCIESDLPEGEVPKRIRTAKFGAPSDLPLLVQRRLFGLDIELLRRTPAGLPARPQYHYFSVAHEGPYWETVARQREIAVSGAVDPKLRRFCLYIVLPPRREEAAR
jgi:type VI secretion system protein ImpJ